MYKNNDFIRKYAMIDAILIIDKSGLLEFYWKSEDVEWEEDLVAALINALEIFVASALEDELLLNISFEEKQIILMRDSKTNLMYSLIARREVPLEIADACLAEIRWRMASYLPLDNTPNFFIDNNIRDSFTKMAQITIASWSLKAISKVKKFEKYNNKPLPKFENVEDVGLSIVLS